MILSALRTHDRGEGLRVNEICKALPSIVATPRGCRTAHSRCSHGQVRRDDMNGRWRLKDPAPVSAPPPGVTHTARDRGKRAPERPFRLAALPVVPDAGIPSERDEGGVVDPSQRAVIREAPREARQVVAAGPGFGKTAVACGRVAALLRAGVEPSRILLLSFTRTAVREMRSPHRCAREGRRGRGRGGGAHDRLLHVAGAHGLRGDAPARSRGTRRVSTTPRRCSRSPTTTCASTSSTSTTSSSMRRRTSSGGARSSSRSSSRRFAPTRGTRCSSIRRRPSTTGPRTQSTATPRRPSSIACVPSAQHPRGASCSTSTVPATRSSVHSSSVPVVSCSMRRTTPIPVCARPSKPGRPGDELRSRRRTRSSDERAKSDGGDLGLAATARGGAGAIVAALPGVAFDTGCASVASPTLRALDRTGAERPTARRGSGRPR